MVRLVTTEARHAGEAPGLEPGMVRLVATGARHAGEAPGLEPGMVRLVAQGMEQPAGTSPAQGRGLPKRYFERRSSQQEPPRLKAGVSGRNRAAPPRSIPGAGWSSAVSEATLKIFQFAA